MHKNTLLAMKLSTVLMSLSAVALIVLLLTGNAAAKRNNEPAQMQKDQAVVGVATPTAIKPLLRMRAPTTTPHPAQPAQPALAAEMAELPAMPDLGVIPDVPEIPAAQVSQRQPRVVTTTS